MSCNGLLGRSNSGRAFSYDGGMDITSMSQTYTAVVKYDEGAWIGWIEEVPGVNCQEATREELLASLRVTLAEAIEFNRAEALGAAGNGYEELPIAV
jgi:predicted RNase H-like HicB family nuclease